MTNNGSIGPGGELNLQRDRNLGELRVQKVSLGWHLKNFFAYRRREVPGRIATRFLGHVAGVITFESKLQGAVYHAEWKRLAPWQAQTLRGLLASNHLVFDLPRHFGGLVTDYGTLSTRLVTTAGVNAIVDAFQNTFEVENFRFHGFGTGTNAEAVGDTALQTEEGTQYATDNTRPTGSQTEGAGANVFRTVATYSPDSGGTRAITEHGIFSQAGTGGGTLLDRSVFSAVNLVASADSLQATYDFTVNNGG